MDWRTVDGGGNTSTGGLFQARSVIGQPDAGKMSGGNFSVAGGFFVGSVSAYTVSGSVELQAFAGTNRMVRFVASEVSGVMTNYLQTNDVTLSFSGATAGYNIQVPPNTTRISAKTAWHLRRRQAVTLNSGPVTVNFTGAANLRGGDLVTVLGGTIDNTDNAVTSTDYLLLLGNYLQTVNGDAAIGRADINGDGAITSSDYLLLLGNYLTGGDPQ